MKKIILSLSAVAVGGLLVVLAAVLFIPADVKDWKPTYPQGVSVGARDVASVDAREIAAALSTPPTHLAQPMKYALYHWQSLIAGVLAFFGGIAAFGAAFIGSQALRHQTDEMVKATREAAEKQADAVRRQAEENTTAVQAQILATEKHIAEEEERRRRNVAAAISGEILSLIHAIDRREMIDMFGEMVNKARNGKIENISFPVANNYFPIFDAVCQEIGSLPGALPIGIVSFYTRARGIVDTMRGLSNGAYDTKSAESVARIAEAVVEDLKFVREFSPTLILSLESYRNTGKA